MPTYLDLAPEQGGTRFGPFAGTIQLGSDPGRTQVQIPGTAAVHATIVDHGNGTFTVAPAARGCAMWLVQGGRAQSLMAPRSARSGDAIVLATANGPRFTLVADLPAPGRPRPGAPIATAGAGVGVVPAHVARRYDREGGVGNALANEAQRQMLARLVRRSPFREIYQIWHRGRSGALLQPRYIVSAVFALVLLAGGSVTTCLGLVSAWVFGG